MHWLDLVALTAYGYSGERFGFAPYAGPSAPYARAMDAGAAYHDHYESARPSWHGAFYRDDALPIRHLRVA